MALPDPEVERTITLTRGAEIAGVSPASMYRAAHRGELPTIRIGNRWMLRTADFLALTGWAA